MGNHDGITTFLSPTTSNFLTRPLLCTQPSRSCSNNNSKRHSNVMDDTNTDNAGLYYDDEHENGADDGDGGNREDENNQGINETYECFGLFRTCGGENGGTGCTIS